MDDFLKTDWASARIETPASLRTLPALADFGDMPLFDTPSLLRAAGVGGAGAGGGDPRAPAAAPGSGGGLFGAGAGALSPCPLSSDAFLRTVHALTGGPSPSPSGRGGPPSARLAGRPPPAPRFTPVAARGGGGGFGAHAPPPPPPFPKLLHAATPGGAPRPLLPCAATPPGSADAAVSAATGVGGGGLFRHGSLPSGSTPATVASWRGAAGAAAAAARPPSRSGRRPSAGTVPPRAGSAASACAAATAADVAAAVAAATAAGTAPPATGAWPGKGSSKYRGVSWHKDNAKWRATIFKGQKPVHIGYFPTPEDAARAYDAEAIKLRGPRTVLNFADSAARAAAALSAGGEAALAALSAPAGPVRKASVTKPTAAARAAPRWEGGVAGEGSQGGARRSGGRQSRKRARAGGVAA